MNDSNKLVKPSVYNMILPKENGIVVYNTKTGRLARSFDNQSLVVKQLLESKGFFQVDEGNLTMVKLYNEGFLIDNMNDEIVQMEEIEKDGMFDNYLRLIILPTEYCNFRCVYCYEHFKRGKMTNETQKRVVEYVEKQLNDFDGLIVNWFGGEPLEALDIIENLSLEFLRICKKYKKAYNAGMTTNGYHLTLENIRLLKKLRVTEYQVTLDGIPAIHDEQRTLIDGSGTSQRIIENLLTIKEQVKSATITIVLRTNFSKKMMKHLDEFQDLLNANFIDDPRFNFFWQMVDDYGYVKDENVRDIFGLKSDYLYLMEHFTKYFNNKFMSFVYGPAGSVCYAFKRNSFVISSDGVIKKCTCDLEKRENHFGEIGKVFNDAKHEKWLYRNISENSKCYSCIKRPICHNRACYKLEGCPPNLLHMEKVLQLVSENEKKYIVI